LVAGKAFGDIGGWIRVGLGLDYDSIENVSFCIVVVRFVFVCVVEMQKTIAHIGVGLGLD
jgi:hypothetical protein